MQIASAKLVPWSSVVGQSVVLLDDTGKAIGQLAILNAGSKERAQEIGQQLVDLFDDLDRHKAVVANLDKLSSSNKR